MFWRTTLVTQNQLKIRGLQWDFKEGTPVVLVRTLQLLAKNSCWSSLPSSSLSSWPPSFQVEGGQKSSPILCLNSFQVEGCSKNLHHGGRGTSHPGKFSVMCHTISVSWCPILSSYDDYRQENYRKVKVKDKLEYNLMLILNPFTFILSFHFHFILILASLHLTTFTFSSILTFTFFTRIFGSVHHTSLLLLLLFVILTFVFHSITFAGGDGCHRPPSRSGARSSSSSPSSPSSLSSS